MKQKSKALDISLKSLSLHKRQADRSEIFSEKIALKLGLTTSDLRSLYQQKRAH
jgi:hypothetical protein